PALGARRRDAETVASSAGGSLSQRLPQVFWRERTNVLRGFSRPRGAHPTRQHACFPVNATPLPPPNIKGEPPPGQSLRTTSHESWCAGFPARAVSLIWP